MARAKITEYRAKKLLLGDAYRGMLLRADISENLPKDGRWVIKVDQGIKKRFKQGLVLLDQSPAQAAKAVAEWEAKGFSQFLAEPFFEHQLEEEQYLSLERVRDGVRILHAKSGGVDVEQHPELVSAYLVKNKSDLGAVAKAANLPEIFLDTLFDAFEKYFFGFLEINPLVVRGNEVHLLDAAVLVDTAGVFFVQDAWSEADVVRQAAKHPAEARVAALDATTPASFTLSVLNPNGSLFLLLSAGGGSIVVADEAQLLGMEKEIANYGEYSGGPTREETYLYAKEILGLLRDSKAAKKVLVIAGPVANFTDVKTTFLGIIDALEELKALLQQLGVKVFVRRGGPNEAAGLELMRAFLVRENLLGAVYGSETPITQPIDDAVDYLHL